MKHKNLRWLALDLTGTTLLLAAYGAYKLLRPDGTVEKAFYESFGRTVWKGTIGAPVQRK